VIDEQATHQPRERLYIHRPKEERVNEEPLLAAVERRPQQLHVINEPGDSHGYLKALLDSMNEHGAYATPLAISIKQSMRDTSRFIDLTDNEGMSYRIKEEGEEEDKGRR
jgi:hypothetical protein